MKNLYLTSSIGGRNLRIVWWVEKEGKLHKEARLYQKYNTRYKEFEYKRGGRIQISRSSSIIFKERNSPREEAAPI